MSDCRENLKWDSLNTDPTFIHKFKKIRKNYNTHRKLIKVLTILLIISYIFTSSIEPFIGNNILFKTILMTLNLITFIGVFYPLSIRKNLTEEDVNRTISEKKKEDDINEKLRERASFN